MRVVLLTVSGLFPDLVAGVKLSVQAFREHLGTARVLVALRGICASFLYSLPRPLGLSPRFSPTCGGACGRRQSLGPDPPPHSQ